MTDEMIPKSDTPTVPSTPIAKKTARKAVAKVSPPKKKKPASKRSAKPASASAKRPKPSSGRESKPKKKTPGHWSKTHAQLVLHATPELVAKLDRKLTKLGKLLKVERATRGAIVRALVERALR